MYSQHMNKNLHCNKKMPEFLRFLWIIIFKFIIENVYFLLTSKSLVLITDEKN